MTDALDRKLAAILSADVVGYSRLMAADEAATIATLTDYRQQIASRVRHHRGRVVDSPGDNVLAEFPTALDAVRAAIEIQGVLRALNEGHPKERRMDFRIGVHMGDVTADGERIYGEGVNIAARLEGLAEAGGVCISATVHEQVRNKLHATFIDIGDQTVKNVPDQVHVYRLQPHVSRDQAGATTRPPPGSSVLRKVGAATAGVLLILGVTLWASWPKPLGILIDLAGVSGVATEPALPERPSLVVLPFENLSGDPAQEFFSDGLTEDLTSELARAPFLFVIARNSAFTYKGKPVNVEEVGRELGVRYVLEGSVRKDAERVRVTVQLIDAATGGHLWSERYDRDLENIFSLQASIAEEVVGRVAGKIRYAEVRRLGRRPTTSLSAYEAYQKGFHHLIRSTKADNEKARELFEHALELDPDFAAAYATLASTYMTEYASGWSRDPSVLDRAEELGLQSIQRDPDYFQGHANLGWVELWRGNLTEALAAADRAIALMPNLEMPHALRALVLVQQGRILEATGEVRRTLRLSPRAPFTGVLATVAYVNFAAGRRSEAIAAMEEARTSAPDLITLRVALTGFYKLEGHDDEAHAEVAEILRVRPDLTAEEAMVLIPGLDRLLSSEEFAALPGYLRQAGLP